uniref:SJCHGC08043 protein n=1 Tax=Schistosoma japonicum TaxID=6182 RepID=Q5DBK9_SCHJA|nr:SJCHGC08043 protein [Schistosoma japonicum]
MGCITHNFHQHESRLVLYKACVRPLLEYCPLILSSHRISDKLKIEGIQRYFTKTMLGIDCALNYTTRCDTLGLEPLWKRRAKLNLTFYFKVVHRLAYFREPVLRFIDAFNYSHTGTV